MRPLCASLVALVLCVAPAHAQTWPMPVAGASASGDPEILFTFDDGPNPRMTPKVLDLLAARGIKAVFFMTADHFEGGDPAAQAVMDRIVREGHIVANHTVNHVDLCTSTPERAAYEIDEARALLEKASGMPVRWFRTPYGVYCPRVVEMLAERGLHNWFWEIDPQEWRTGSAKKTIQRVIWSMAHTRGRAVLLMHDIKAATVAALPKIFEWLDNENARRTAAGQRPIRVVDGPAYARELLGEEAIGEAIALWNDLEIGLAAGLASALP